TTVGSDNFHFMAPFLAMTELKRALFCSFGLTKTFFNFNQFPQLRNLNRFVFKQKELFMRIYIQTKGPSQTR
ncbi:MAG: hypothetical protein MR898_03900, partial [Prevotella sp.]|nr:hypothetical protein [Prevotella sp.]